MITDLQGQIERITYTNEENGYTIAKVRVQGERDLLTIVGNLMAPAPGEVLEMRGEWTRHPKYGSQFRVLEYRSLAPASIQGIEKYLGSGLIKGIGPVMAKRIVSLFGKETFDIIEKNVDKLATVPGIGQKRVDMIKKAWRDQREIRELMVFLHSHGVGAGYAARIFKQYGDRSVAVVKRNPYRLATDILGIGFVTADRIAEKLGFSKDASLRVEAGILYVLNELADEGHVFYPYEPLVRKCRDALEVDRDLIVKALGNVALDRRIVIEDLSEAIDGLRNNDKAVYLARFHVAEVGIMSRFKALLATAKSMRDVDTAKAVEWVQARMAIKLAQRQIEAIERAVESKSIVITGGPGTGKTTIIRAILQIFSRLSRNMMLAAPTGRAAKRMTEATGWEAKTIHRLLEFSLQRGGFQRNEDNPLPCDLLIIDEASMIDNLLLYHLLKAVPPTAIFILVGDVDQLPSVGPGNVLRDIIASGVVPVVRLNEIFRQARESLIIVNAHRINRGMVPAFRQSRQIDDFYFIEQEGPEEVLRIILELVKERIPKRFGLDPMKDIQVLTPMHKGVVGTGNLNATLQKALNPGEDLIVRGNRNFRLKDKVMQVRNNYDKEVYNGDIGNIVRVDAENQEILISFDGREVPYDYTDMDEILPAYAVSVHKSQGSEYPAVVMPVLTQHFVLLQRNLVYTAVTRGKKLVVLVGTGKALSIAVGNDKTQRRYTLLKNRLQQLIR